MKVNTPQERMSKKRNNRLQKKLHVGAYQVIGLSVKFEFEPFAIFDDQDKITEKFWQLHDSVVDVIHCGSLELGCMGTSKPEDKPDSKLIFDAYITFKSADFEGLNGGARFEASVLAEVLVRMDDILKKYNGVFTGEASFEDAWYPEG